MPKKRIRLEFTVISDAEGTEWRLDKKLHTLRMMLKTEVGPVALLIFQQWLEQTTENPNYVCATKPPKRAGGKGR